MGLRETLSLEHLRYVPLIDEYIGHGSIVDIIAVCTRWKESSRVITGVRNRSGLQEGMPGLSANFAGGAGTHRESDEMESWN